MPILRFIAIALGAYLIGSVSPALIISRHVEKKDVRQFGSGNAGASNMVRNFGWAAGLATFGLDMRKGAAATLLGKWAGGDLGAAIAAVAVVLGHSFPVYYGFRGGKGVSASMGAMLAVAPLPSLVVYLIAILIVALTGIVSIGSLLGFTLESLMVWVIFPDLVGQPLKWALLVLTILTFVGHRENIKRLLQGKENKITPKKKV